MEGRKEFGLDKPARLIIRLLSFGKLNQSTITDMISVTSSTSIASVNKDLARVKLSRGNAQSVFFPKM